MLFFGSYVFLKIAALIFAVTVWLYFGQLSFYLHPDRFIGSIISYIEKSLNRNKTESEGAVAVALSAFLSYCASYLILHYAMLSGSIWYFAFSSAVIYFSINDKINVKISGTDPRISSLLPIIFSVIMLGPAGAFAFRTVTLFILMFSDKEGYERYTSSAYNLHSSFTDFTLSIKNFFFNK